MKTPKQQEKYEIIFQKLNHLSLGNAEVTMLCAELNNDLDSSFQIINEMQGISEINTLENVQCYSGS